MRTNSISHDRVALPGIPNNLFPLTPYPKTGGIVILLTFSGHMSSRGLGRHLEACLRTPTPFDTEDPFHTVRMNHRQQQQPPLMAFPISSVQCSSQFPRRFHDAKGCRSWRSAKYRCDIRRLELSMQSERTAALDTDLLQFIFATKKGSSTPAVSFLELQQCCFRTSTVSFHFVSPQQQRQWNLERRVLPAAVPSDHPVCQE